MTYPDPIDKSTPPESTSPYIDYTAQDYVSMKRHLVSMASTKFGDKFNRFFEHDFGIMILEFIAAMHDQQSFKMDFLANESFYTTAILPKNIIKHAKRWSYSPRERTGARYKMAATVVKPYSFDIVIPAGFRISTSGFDADVVYVELYLADGNMEPIYDQNIVIPRGVSSITNIVGLEGQYSSINVNGQGVQFQSIQISDQLVIPNSIMVEVDGVPWRREEIFAANGPEQIFKLDRDEKTGLWYILTGDGVNGAVFPEGSVVQVEYRIGGGSRGNLPSGYIDVTQAIVTAGEGSSTVNFANIEKGFGGGDEETVSEIRRNLPYWIKSQGRLVTLDDYSLHARRFSSNSGRVARARAYLRSSGCAANIIDVFVLENSMLDKPPVTPSDSLIVSLTQSIEEIADCTHHVCVKKGTVVPFNVLVQARMPSSYSSKKSMIESSIKNVILDHFKSSDWDFGSKIRKSDMSRIIEMQINEIDTDCKIEMYPGYSLEENGDFMTRHYQFAYPKNIDINIEFSNKRNWS
jgi:hypothetical protein